MIGFWVSGVRFEVSDFDIRNRIFLIVTDVGQTQYLTGNYVARQTLRKELVQRPSDNLALLYLGLAEARLGDRQVALGHIEHGMMGIDPPRGSTPGGSSLSRRATISALLTCNSICSRRIVNRRASQRRQPSISFHQVVEAFLLL
jgi:hypothetical protein